jgi:hypothetical protein
MKPAWISKLKPKDGWYEPWSGHLGFMVHKESLVQVLAEYFNFLDLVCGTIVSEKSWVWNGVHSASSG